MSRLVERFGRTGAAAVLSLIWALPMAAWAGSADLTPIDKTAYPKVALAIAIAMLALWLFLLTRLARVPVAQRERRLDLGRMSSAEKRWTLALFIFATGLIAWLNAAATVDWSPLWAGVGAGKTGPVLFAIGLAGFLGAMLAGLVFSWRQAGAAFRRRALGRG
jgi:hypothetical protein